MKKTLYLVTALTFIACANKEEKLKYLICKDSILYWNVERESNEDADLYVFTYGFNKNGNVITYGYRKDLNQRCFLGCDSIYRKDCLKWKIKGDTIIYKVYSIKEKITKISENRDTIYTISFYDGYLVNAPKIEKVKYTRVHGKLNIKN